MRKIIVVIAALFALFGAGTAVQAHTGATAAHWPFGSAEPKGSSAARIASGCGGTIVFGYGLSPEWITRWRTTPNPRCYQRAALACRNPINRDIVWEHGSWHYGTNESGVNCNSLETAAYGGVDIARQAGSPYTYQQLHTFASASVRGSPHLAVATNPCNQGFTWGTDGRYGWEAASTWQHNYDNCWQATSLKCRDRFGTHEWVHAGWTFPPGRFSGANCPATWTPVQANINESSLCGCWNNNYYYYVYYKWN
jgi:hypothetical protein